MKIIFVCLGNICRSPAAEELARHRLNLHPELDCDIISRGIGTWNLGHKIDERMMHELNKLGIQTNLDKRAELLTLDDLKEAQYIFVSDRHVEEYVFELVHKHLAHENRPQIHLMTVFSHKHKNDEIPDPFFGDQEGFRKCAEMLHEVSSSIIEILIATNKIPLKKSAGNGL